MNRLKMMTKPAVLLVLVCTGSVIHAQTHEVVQENKQFSAPTLLIKVGDTVNFKNNDAFFHNVFSLSDAAMFDLGSYPKGESRPVTFEQTGTVEVECAIHPEMKMTIEVKE